MSRILVVDDEPALLDLLKEHLTMEGYTVDTAPSGEYALDLMRIRPPDLVILDIMLPGIDGYEVCTRMQSDPKLQDIPVIMLTAKSLTSDLVAGYESGAEDYVTKPFDIDELLIRIRARLYHLYSEKISDLTGLPGKRAIEEEIDKRIRPGTNWKVVSITISNFRIYNEAYSFSEGDNLIRTASECLQKAVNNCEPSDGFLGHVGGPQFIAIVKQDNVEALKRQAKQAFQDAVQTLLSNKDKERGYIIALDRDGVAKKWAFPNLNFSLDEKISLDSGSE